MEKKLASLALVAFLVVAMGCGGGGGSLPPSPTAPTPPTGGGVPAPAMPSIQQIGAIPANGAMLQYGWHAETTLRYSNAPAGMAVVSCLSVDGENIVPYFCGGKTLVGTSGLVTTDPYMSNPTVSETRYIIHMMVPGWQVLETVNLTPLVQISVPWVWRAG